MTPSLKPSSRTPQLNIFHSSKHPPPPIPLYVSVDLDGLADCLCPTPAPVSVKTRNIFDLQKISQTLCLIPSLQKYLFNIPTTVLYENENKCAGIRLALRTRPKRSNGWENLEESFDWSSQMNNWELMWGLYSTTTEIDFLLQLIRAKKLYKSYIARPQSGQENKYIYKLRLLKYNKLSWKGKHYNIAGLISSLISFCWFLSLDFIWWRFLLAIAINWKVFLHGTDFTLEAW